MLAMDLLILRESIAALENRYEILLEVCEENALSSAAQIKDLTVDLERVDIEKGEAQKRVEDLQQKVSVRVAQFEKERKERVAVADRVKFLEGKLVVVRGERDARVKEKQKEVEELKQQVSARTAELEAERQEKAAGAQRMKALEGELAGVKGEREAQAKKAKEAREEAELTLLQLHQVQEELEHYFLKSRAVDQLAAVQQDQLLRAQALMARLLPEASTLAQAQRVAVEVLPPSPPAAPVQTEALLNSYSTILRRASALLQRAIRS